MLIIFADLPQEERRERTRSESEVFIEWESAREPQTFAEAAIAHLARSSLDPFL